jgi:hypothetical protein
MKWPPFVILTICFGFFVGHAVAQGVDDAFGPNMFSDLNTIRGSDESNPFNDSNDSDELGRPHGPNHLKRYHFSSTGKPCIVLQPYTTVQSRNKKIYEHWINAINSCGQNIKIQVCYYKTNDCVVMNVPPWESKNSVLGIYANRDFQYDAKEK